MPSFSFGFSCIKMHILPFSHFPLAQSSQTFSLYLQFFCRSILPWQSRQADPNEHWPRWYKMQGFFLFKKGLRSSCSVWAKRQVKRCLHYRPLGHILVRQFFLSSFFIFFYFYSHWGSKMFAQIICDQACWDFLCCCFQRRDGRIFAGWIVFGVFCRQYRGLSDIVFNYYRLGLNLKLGQIRMENISISFSGSQPIDCIVDVLGQQNFGLEGCLALAVFLSSLVQFGWLAELSLQILVLHQQPIILSFECIELLLFLDQIGLQPTFLKFEDISDLLNLPIFNRFQLHLHLLPDLHGLSPRDSMVMKDVHIGNTFFLEVILQFFAPIGQEFISAGKQGVRLLGCIQFLAVQVVLHLGLGCDIRDFGFELVVSAFEFKDVSFVAVDQLVQRILFQRVGGLELSHLLSVLVTKLVDLINQIVDLFIFKSKLGIQDLEFGILVLDCSVEILELSLRIILDLSHRSCIVLKVVVFQLLQTNDLLAQHLDRQFLIIGHLLVLLLPALSLFNGSLKLFLKISNSLVKVSDFILMSLLNLIEIAVKFRNILIVLGFQSVDRIKEFDLVLSLDNKDFILQPADMGFQVVLDSLVLLDLLLIAFKKEGYLGIFLCDDLVEVFDFFRQGRFDIGGNFPEMKDSAFSFGNKLSPAVDRFLVILQIGLGKFLLDGCQSLFKPGNLIILFILDPIQLEFQAGLGILFARDQKLGFLELLLKLVLLRPCFRFESVDLLQVLLFDCGSAFGLL